jgi:diketogulonate reductase-like aldo/keto reductase
MDMRVSKFIYGTGHGVPTEKADYMQYTALKKILMSGGINRIDTAAKFRRQKAELTVGWALRTLIEKYGFSRNEFFITSKNGTIVHNNYEDAPAELQYEELILSG